MAKMEPIIVENKLALEIADKVIAICNEYIKGENAVTGAPEITKGNENNIKIFLKGLACKMARPDELTKEMESIKSLIVIKENKSIKDLFKNSSIDKSFRKLYKSEKPEAHALLNREPTLAQPILLMQFPPRVGLFMNEIEKALASRDYKEQDVIMEGIFGEIQNLVERSQNDVGTWQGYVENFKAKVNECWKQGNFPKGILTACAKAIGTDINNNYGDALGEISSIQKMLSDMMDNNNDNKSEVSSVEYAESLNKNLPEKINSNIEKYITNLKNICDRINDPEYYNQFNSPINKKMVDEIRDYLEGELKKYEPDNNKTALENGKKFDEWAEGIRSQLVIDEQVVDGKIAASYRKMVNCLSLVKGSLNVGKTLEKILNKKG